MTRGQVIRNSQLLYNGNLLLALNPMAAVMLSVQERKQNRCSRTQMFKKKKNDCH